MEYKFVVPTSFIMFNRSDFIILFIHLGLVLTLKINVFRTPALL